jgi:hypothetical protein
MSKTLTLEADVNSANTRTNVNGQGSVSAPSRVTPSNAKKISQILVASSADGAAEGAANILIRLGGNAVRNGEQCIIAAGLAGNTVQSGSDTNPVFNPMFKLTNADIDVDPSEVINVDAEVVGDDLGDVTVVVTLIYD